MNSARPAVDPVAAATIHFLDQLFVLARQLGTQGREHEGVAQAAQSTAAALAQAQPPFALQLPGEGVLRDRVALPLSLEDFRRFQHIATSLGRLGIQEMSFEPAASEAACTELAALIHNAAQKHSRTTIPKLEGVRFGALRRSTSHDAGDAALELFAANQVAVAIDEAAWLFGAAQSWPWPQGRALCRRFERCLGASVSATARALELSPAPWSPPRRALCAVVRIGAVLSRLQVSALTTRAAMHALLSVAAHGLRERLGLPFAEAAKRALPALLPSQHDLPSDIDPHRLQVCTLVHSAAGALDGTASLPLARLLHIAYELERQRCPGPDALTRSTLDLQAWLCEAVTAGSVHGIVGRALLSTVGLVPAGAHVLSDGRLGVVMSSSGAGDALRPRVLVGGKIEIPNESVRLWSALAMTPFAK